MNLRKIITFVIALNITALSLFGQSNCECPTNIEVVGPAGVLKAGEPAIFTAHVSNDKGESTYT